MADVVSEAIPDKCAVIADQEAEIKRLHDLVLDACKVFEHYDLPEHAFHYRRALSGLDEAKAEARAAIHKQPGAT